MDDKLKHDKAFKDQVALMTFVDDLIKERPDMQFAPEQMANARAALLKEVNEAINSHIVRVLPEAAQKELDQLLDQKVSDEELDEFFDKKIPNLSEEIAAVLLEFRTTFLYDLQSPKEKRMAEESSHMTPPPAPVAPEDFEDNKDVN